MKNFKRVLAMVFVVLMVVSVLAACAKKDEDKKTDPTQAPTQVATATETSAPTDAATDAATEAETPEPTVADEEKPADSSSYIGKYVNTVETGETTLYIAEDGSFQMVTLGTVNQTVVGLYKFGVTNSADVIKLVLYPHRSFIEENGNEVETDVPAAEGVAVIENGTLTLEMECEPTVFTKE